jgi:hypothetical protein
VEALIPPVSPAIVLSVLVGAFHTCLYVFIRGTIRRHLLAVLVAAIAGAYVGQAIGRRAGDPLLLGDYSLLWASVMAWAGIVVVIAVVAIRPERRADETADAGIRGPADTGTSTGTGTESTTTRG